MLLNFASFRFSLKYFNFIICFLLAFKNSEPRPEPRPMPYVARTKNYGSNPQPMNGSIGIVKKFKHVKDDRILFRKSSIINQPENKDWNEKNAKKEFGFNTIVEPHEFCTQQDKNNASVPGVPQKLTIEKAFKNYLPSMEEIEVTLARTKNEKSWPPPSLKKKFLKLSMKLSEIQNLPGARQYEYCKNLNDNQGITAGVGGFTTSWGDALLVLQRYKKISGSSSMERYEEALNFLKKSSNISDYNIPYYCCAWKHYSKNDESFRQAQVDVLDALVYVPAMKLSEKLAESIKAEKLPPLLMALIYDINFEFGQDEAMFIVSQVLDGLLETPNVPNFVNVQLTFKALLEFRAAFKYQPPTTSEYMPDYDESERYTCFSQFLEQKAWEMSQKLTCKTKSVEFTIE